MAAELLTDASRALDGNASPYAGAKWTFFLSGTSTPANVYADANLSTSLGSSVTADAGGKFVPIYFDSSVKYRGVLKNADASVTIYDIDPINPGVIAEFGLGTGAGLVGFDQSETYTAGSLGDRLSKEVYVTDPPFNATGNGVTYDTAAVQAAIAHLKDLGGGILKFPPGNYRIASSLVVDFDGLILDGAGQEQTQLWIQHNGAAISFTSAVANLPNAKFSVNRMKIVNKQGYALDLNGFPQDNMLGSTGLKLFECFGSSFTDLLIEGFEKSLDIDDSALLEFYNFTDRNCWTGRYFSGFSNHIAFRGGVVNNSSIDTDRDEVRAIIFDNVDIEAASQTITLGDGAVFKNCRIERLHISRDWFKWFQINGDDNLFIDGTRLFWDGTTLPGDGEDEFFIEVAGERNTIEVPYVYNHERVIKLTTASRNNLISWQAPFNDYANSNSNPLYLFSRRFLIDGGTNNRIEWLGDTSRVTTQGQYVQRSEGALNSYLRYEVLGNLTISGGAGLIVASSDIAGPFSVPAANVNVKKFTLEAASIHRAFAAPSGLTGDGTKKFGFSAWIYIPSGSTGVTRVRLGPGDGTFVNLYQTDGASKWHHVVGFHQTPNGDPVQWMIEAEGDDGDVFYVAFPSLGDGSCISYVDRKSSDTTNNRIDAPSFDSNMIRYDAALV